MTLRADQIERYARNIRLPGVGEEGQERLLAGRVLVVGVGGLGSPAALYLAAAGIGVLGLMDADRVEPSNLQRQVLHHTPDIGRLKVESAAEKLRALNPDVRIQTYPERLTPDHAADVVQSFDFILDATDNFASKFLVADACHVAGRPYAHAGVHEFEGQVMTVLPGKTACYRCIFREPPAESPGAPPAGVMGFLPGVLGCLQAAEAVRFLLKRGDLLTNRILVYDALHARFRCVRLTRDPGCPLCGDHPVVRPPAAHT